MKLTYTTPIDRGYYKDKTDKEKIAQSYMDKWYRSFGYVIVNRTGTKQRDLILMKNNVEIRVEEKFREKDYGDLLIEIIQDVVSNNPGWFYSETFDRLSYVTVDNNYKPVQIYWIKFVKFKSWLFDYLTKKKRAEVVFSPLGYGLTMNLPISWQSIPKEYYQKFDYDPILCLP